jgi:hypothetical protein
MATDQPRNNKPNIVFFLWDNLGWGEPGCYGGGILRGAATPRIDRLADGGLKLLNFKEHIQIGAITQFVTAIATKDRSALPHTA